MGVYIYCIKEDYQYQSGITGRYFENDWMRLTPEGVIIVKGTHIQGYAWDGCSPKWKFKNIYFGTPESILNKFTDRSRTFYASLIHDILYQFSYDLKYIIDRKEADLEFYKIMDRDNFELKNLYYHMVRLFGWPGWYLKRKK